MSYAYRCPRCPVDTRPTWRILRHGDAVVSWACNEHLGRHCHELQRNWEHTELVVTLSMVAERTGPA